MFGIGFALRDVHKTPCAARGHGDDIIGVKVHKLFMFPFVPLTAPFSSESNKGLIGVVVVHERTTSGFCLAVTQVKSLGDRNGGHR